MCLCKQVLLLIILGDFNLNIFKNFTVGTKILAGNFIALALMILVGGVAIVRLNTIQHTVSDLADNLAVDQHLADQIESRILLARFYANKYIRDQKPEDMAQYQEALANFETLLAEADTTITKPQQVEILNQIKTGAQTYKSTFDEVSQLIDNREQTISTVLDVEGPMAQQKLDQLAQAAFDDNDFEVAYYALKANEALELMRLNAFRYIEHGDESWLEKFEKRYTEANAAFDSLEVDGQDTNRRGLMDEAATAVDHYAEGFATLHSDYSRQNELIETQLNVIGPQIRQTASNISTSVQADFQAQNAATTSLVMQSMTILGIIMVAAVVLVTVIALFLARTIANAVNIVTYAAIGIAEGDLEQWVEVHSNDELGRMAAAFQQMITHLKQMASTADRLAQGDLTADIEPKSERDVLGNALARMISSLRNLVGQMTDNANKVAKSSNQLTAAANQTDQATNQIRTTMQQLAAGAQQQSSSALQTKTSIDQIARAIDGMAHGAQEQAVAVAESASITNQISSAIQQVATNAQAGANDASNAAQTARHGVSIVDDTIRGMHTIKAKVGISTQRVQEMGQRSQQIGAIVATIEDIAAQTNLLALNAAVEAARAGEHGKGFAVVADEVRKLAEKSASATGEIAGLIRTIQQSVTEAVTAMEDGATEVESGVGRANEAGQALADILSAIEAVDDQVKGISTATQQMSSSAKELVNAMERVSEVVEENSAATEEMAAGSNEVAQMVDKIARVSQENSAAVDEVSFSVEKMGSQVQEVSTSAQNLNEMAQSLKGVVAQFKLNTTKTDTSEVPLQYSNQVKDVTPESLLANGNGYHAY